MVLRRGAPGALALVRATLSCRCGAIRPRAHLRPTVGPHLKLETEETPREYADVEAPPMWFATARSRFARYRFRESYVHAIRPLAHASHVVCPAV
jgi:hypothetical protein